MSTAGGIVGGLTALALAPVTGGASLAAAGLAGAAVGSKVGRSLTPKIPGLPESKEASKKEPPKIEDPEVQTASAKERKLLRLRRGRQSTILSRPKLQQTGDTLG